MPGCAYKQDVLELTMIRYIDSNHGLISTDHNIKFLKVIWLLSNHNTHEQTCNICFNSPFEYYHQLSLLKDRWRHISCSSAAVRPQTTSLCLFLIASQLQHQLSSKYLQCVPLPAACFARFASLVTDFDCLLAKLFLYRVSKN